LSEKEEETYSVMFSSLKHAVRRKILRILVAKSYTFTEILQQINIESAHLSYHLESLGDLIKKNNGKYELSDLGCAAASLMTRVEEPERLVTPSILKTPRRLQTVRIFSGALIVIGILLLVNGALALPAVDYRQTRIQSGMDTDYWVFQPENSPTKLGFPYNLTSFSGCYYLGPGLYGIQIDFQINDSFQAFPLLVRICTPKTGSETTDLWNQSWYEFSRPISVNQPEHERFAVTFLASEDSAQIITQEDFGHVHPSPGKVIGEFRPTNALVLIRVASDIGDRNVTLSGGRPAQAFAIEWLYSPQPRDEWKYMSMLSGLSLIVPSAVFVFTSKILRSRKEDAYRG
jgi:hypothetical protein